MSKGVKPLPSIGSALRGRNRGVAGSVASQPTPATTVVSFVVVIRTRPPAGGMASLVATYTEPIFKKVQPLSVQGRPRAM